MLDDILRGPLSFHSVAPPALGPFDGMEMELREVALALQLDPSNSELHAAIGNGLIRQTRYMEAIEAYRAAICADAANAPAQLALAELLALARDPQAAAQLESALVHCRVYRDPRTMNGQISVLLLLRDAPYSVNAPLELIADGSQIAIHKLYVEQYSGEALPEYDVAFCGFGYARAAERAIEAAARLLRGLRCPVVNRPERLVRAARENLRSTLQRISGVSVPATVVRDRSQIEIHEPALVRPVDTHAGLGLECVRNDTEMLAHCARWPAQRYHVTPFAEYVSADGYYRKYRVVVIDGIAYPYHLGVSPRWMVHYRNAPMAEHAWMREEEARFLADPRAVFPGWDSLRAVADAIGLDYFGVDCARLADGTMLVFEADPAMLVHDEDAAGVFSYKRPAVAAIRHALTAALASRAQNEGRIRYEAAENKS